jgi:hypothetical protein
MALVSVKTNGIPRENPVPPYQIQSVIRWSTWQSEGFSWMPTTKFQGFIALWLKASGIESLNRIGKVLCFPGSEISLDPVGAT